MLYKVLEDRSVQCQVCRRRCIIPPGNTGFCQTRRNIDGNLHEMAHWIVDHMGPETPWHVTRFVPHLKLSHVEYTPISKLEQARQIGIDEGIKYVYLGNVPGHPAKNAYIKFLRVRSFLALLLVKLTVIVSLTCKFYWIRGEQHETHGKAEGIPGIYLSLCRGLGSITQF